MESNMIHTQKEKQSQRSKDGCSMCRTRKKKCNEQHPVCSGCRRNGHECEWPSAEKPQRKRRPQRRQLPLLERALPPQIAAMITIFAVPSAHMVHRLLAHFTDYSPRWLSTRTGCHRTEFLHHLIPAGMGSPLVFNCILTVAATDLIKYNSSDLELKGAAVEYYGLAVAGIRQAIAEEILIASTPHAYLSDYTLLAVLLVCLHEVQNFSATSRLLPHLNAAAALLYHRLQNTPPNSELRSFLSELFCYYFSLTAFSDGSSLAIHQGLQIFESSSLLKNLQGGSIMGTSQQIFLIIFRASALVWHTTTPGLPPDKTVKSRLAVMERQLHSWHNQLPIGIGDIDIEQRSDAITTELYRLACLLYLKRTIEPSILNCSSSIQTIVTAFIASLELLSPDHPANCILCWPLVVVGLCTTLHAHQRIITARLAKIYELWNSDILLLSVTFLREKWKNVREQECLLPLQVGSKESVPYGLHNLQLPVVLL